MSEYLKLQCKPKPIITIHIASRIFVCFDEFDDKKSTEKWLKYKSEFPHKRASASSTSLLKWMGASPSKMRRGPKYKDKLFF